VSRNLAMLGLTFCHVQDRANGKDPTFHCVCPEERNTAARRRCLEVKPISSSLTGWVEFQADSQSERPPTMRIDFCCVATSS
jgi:hypothetical protein